MFHANTAVFYKQMNKILTYIIVSPTQRGASLKFFMKCFYKKSIFSVIYWVYRKEKPAQFLETVILCKAVPGKF